jgi:hypothetical protein
MLEHPMSEVDRELINESYLNKSPSLSDSSTGAPTRLLVEKGLITKEEFLEVMKKIDREMGREGKGN